MRVDTRLQPLTGPHSSGRGSAWPPTPWRGRPAWIGSGSPGAAARSTSSASGDRRGPPIKQVGKTPDRLSARRTGVRCPAREGWVGGDRVFGYTESLVQKPPPAPTGRG